MHYFSWISWYKLTHKFKCHLNTMINYKIHTFTYPLHILEFLLGKPPNVACTQRENVIYIKSLKKCLIINMQPCIQIRYCHILRYFKTL